MTLLDEIKSGERLSLEFKQKLPQDARKRILFEEDVRIKNDQHN